MLRLPTRPPRRALAWAAWAALVGASGPAAAAPWLELRWRAVPGCPEQAEVADAAGRLVVGEAPRRVVAEATVLADARGFTLRLAVEGPNGVQRRELTSPRCAALADAAAVILAVAAEPPVVPLPPADAADAGVAPAAPVVGATAPLADEPVPAAPPVRAAAARRRPEVGLFVAAAGGRGPSRRFVPGVQLGLALLWPRARLDVRGATFFADALRFPDRPDAGAELRLAAGAVRGCPRWTRRTLAVQACAGVELGALLARGFGLDEIARPRGLWAAGLLAPGVMWRPWRGLGIGAEVEGLVAFTRRAYAAEDAPGLLYRVPTLGLRVSGGVTLIFP